MRYSFSVARELVEDHVYWIARCKDVSTLVGQGDTPEEAIAELEENETTWLAFAAEQGLEIPSDEPAHKKRYSGKFVTRISPSAHAMAAMNAAADGISLNQYVSDAISYYNGRSERRAVASNVVAGDFNRNECKEM